MNKCKIGITCIFFFNLTSDPVGYYFKKNGQNGVILYEFPFTSNSDMDQIAFGFMTRQENAVLYRIVGNVGNEYIEIRLVCELDYEIKCKNGSVMIA